MYGDPDAVDRSGCGYNEVVIKGDAYKKVLPHVVAAFFFPRGDEFIHHAEGSEARARDARAAFLKKYHRVQPEEVPLLAYDLAHSRNGKRPFRFADDDPPSEDDLCSCPDLADRTKRPWYPLQCSNCPM